MTLSIPLLILAPLPLAGGFGYREELSSVLVVVARMFDRQMASNIGFSHTAGLATGAQKSLG